MLRAQQKRQESGAHYELKDTKEEVETNLPTKRSVPNERQLHALAIVATAANWTPPSELFGAEGHRKQKRAHSCRLSAGNQIQIYSLVLAGWPPEQRERTPGELRQIDWRSSGESSEPPSLFCESLRSTERANNATTNQLEPGQRLDSTGSLLTTAGSSRLEPSIEAQLSSFFGATEQQSVSLARSKLVRLAGLKRKIRAHNGGQLLESCLYALERLSAEFKENLASSLASSCRKQLGEMRSIWEVCCPLGEQEAIEVDAFGTRQSSDDSGILVRGSQEEAKEEQEPCGNFNLVSQPEERLALFRVLLSSQKRRRKQQRLKLERAKLTIGRHFELRSSKQVRSIIDYSSGFFAELLSTSALLRLDLAQAESNACESRQAVKLQQLKLFACVECQKLRARVRHEWLPQCLYLAFDYLQKERASRDQDTNANQKGLPALMSHEPCFEVAYFEHLAVLMGQLMRRHFLSAAYDLWLVTIERSLLGPFRLSDGQARRAKLSTQVELLVDHENGRLFASCASSTQQQTLVHLEPSEAMKQTLDFVCHELASVCLRLPRLEDVLELAHRQRRQSAAYDGDDGTNGEWHLDSNNTRHLPVLSQEDELVQQTKSKLGKLIDRCEPASVNICSTTKITRNPLRRELLHEHTIASHLLGQHQSRWLDANYLFVIQVLSHFSSGSTKELDPLLDESYSFETSATIMSGDCKDVTRDERVCQLQKSCKQVKLLDELGEMLALRLERFFYCGQLLELDCEPLRQSLSKLIARERALLVRLKCDELIRLMEQLSLQFDDLELNIDLEVAIEDYLSERWQTKQSQQPGEFEQELLFETELSREAELVYVEAPTMHTNREEQEENLTPNSATLIGRLDNEEEELANALACNNNPNVAHLFALSQQTAANRRASAASALKSDNKIATNILRPVGEKEQQIGDRVAPLIECRLLVERYSYLNEFLINEIGKLTRDKELTFEGLIFLSEYVPSNWAIKAVGSGGGEAEKKSKSYERDEETVKHQLEMINNLSRRASEFLWLLDESIDRLEKSRLRLLRSVGLRARVLSKTIIEFDCLMSALGELQLHCGGLKVVTECDETCRGGNDKLNGKATSVEHLDAIQETANWAQKLQLRLDFLICQNELMNKELSLLCDKAKLDQKLNDVEVVTKNRKVNIEYEQLLDQLEFTMRANVLANWLQLSQLLAQFWKLAEQFETQQVKWLNSDLKKIDYTLLDKQFKVSYEDRIAELQEQVSKSIVEQMDSTKDMNQAKTIRSKYLHVLQNNIRELSLRLNQFRSHRLPVFKFISSEHLTNDHWQQLGQVLASKNKLGVQQLNADNYTTVAQLLELEANLNVENNGLEGGVSGQQFVSYLIELNHRATIEHELTSLLLDEARRAEGGAKRSVVVFRLENWTKQELVAAASRFIGTKLAASGHLLAENSDARHLWANKLVSCYLSVCRLAQLGTSLDLNLVNENHSNSTIEERASKRHLLLVKSAPKLLDRYQLENEEQSTLFVEFLRLFCDWLAGDHVELSRALHEIRQELTKIDSHRLDIDELLSKLNQLKSNELQVLTSASERNLSMLERDNLNLEMEREKLATREALGIEKQREALSRRDEFVRQITERALPALRAATRALDCLGDGQSLRSLRSFRPRPPLVLRLVIEPVCLLRNSAVRLKRLKGNDCNRKSLANEYPVSPVRTFDPLSGRILEDYWPIAWRTLNGLNSFELLQDLREQVNGHLADRKIIQLIKRKYLAHKEFSVASIEKISHDCGHLARWLLAVDVFNQVLEVVRPNYAEYLKSEKQLGELFEDLTKRRQQIEQLGARIEHTESAIREQIRRRNSMADLLAESSKQVRQIESIREELDAKQEHLTRKLGQLERKSSQIVAECASRTAKFLFVGSKFSQPSNKVTSQGAIERLIELELSLGENDVQKVELISGIVNDRDSNHVRQ